MPLSAIGCGRMAIHSAKSSGWQSPAEVAALDFVASKLAKEGKLFFRFDAGGNDGKTEASAQLDGGFHDRSLVAAFRYFADQWRADPEPLNRNALKAGQRHGTGPEAIQGGPRS